MKHQTAIRDYFAKRVGCYEAVYSKKYLRGLRNTIYWLGWFPLRLIFRYTFKYLAGVNPQSVLDIGCGTGVYLVELARRGIDVTGLDSCKEMIDAAENHLIQSGLSGRIKTVLADYLDWSEKAGQKYDLALAIGVMDYVDDTGIYLASLRRVAQEVIVTFPGKYTFSFMASFGYRHHGVRAYFYTQEQIRHLLGEAGFMIVHFTKIFPNTYWVHAK